MSYKVVEIFDSLEGEGKRAGYPASFVRLAGCNLRCLYCDTMYAVDVNPGEYHKMHKAEIMSRLNQRFKRVTLTGGEPLIACGVCDLVSEMLADGFEVNIETNGSVDIQGFLSNLRTKPTETNLFFTIDYKLPSSGVTDKMFDKNYLNLTPQDVLKFVVGSDYDIEVMINFMQYLKDLGVVSGQVFIGVVYGSYSLSSLARAIIETPVLKDSRLQLQYHKIIWDPNIRGV